MRVWRINEGDNCVMRYALPVADIFMDAEGMIGWRGCNGKLEGLERIGFLPEDVPARLLNDVKYFWRSREARSTLWVTSRLNQMKPNT